MIRLAKKKNEDIREKFIKIMLTDEEYKEIDRYARLQFQTKSDFIRLAIRNRITEINKSIYPSKADPRFEKGRVNRHEILKELKESQTISDNEKK